LPKCNNERTEGRGVGPDGGQTKLMGGTPRIRSRSQLNVSLGQADPNGCGKAIETTKISWQPTGLDRCFWRHHEKNKTKDVSVIYTVARVVLFEAGRHELLSIPTNNSNEYAVPSLADLCTTACNSPSTYHVSKGPIYRHLVSIPVTRRDKRN